MNKSSNPYSFLPSVPTFQLNSNDINDGESMSLAQASGIMGAGGDDISPHLSWSDPPSETKSFVVTCFDPDAPTGSGFWHWIVYDIPPTIRELSEGSGTTCHNALPEGAKHLKNDAGLFGYVGAAPPSKHGPHRYIFVVHALSIETMPIDKDSSAAVCGFNMFGRTLGRGMITAIYEEL